MYAITIRLRTEPYFKRFGGKSTVFETQAEAARSNAFQNAQRANYIVRIVKLRKGRE